MLDRKSDNQRRKKKIIRPKICKFCEDGMHYIDFKDVETLRKYQTEKGKIHPRRITGTCSDHQKMLAAAIKRARDIALVL
ncbi:MAG: 30S ribosomal protein S18 [Kiritimatiellaeota bacterium]|nr:30S ribosomal protein S18 [Kiritimatiellota bacterium]